MRKYVIAALVLVTLGIGASIFLLPNPTETEHAKARDQQTIDVGNVDVEAEYNQGRRSFPIVSALADKRVLVEGNRPAATALMEEYVKNNPNDPQGHQKLAEQYIMSGRKDDYNNQITILSNLAPTEETLITLSYIYNEEKNYPKQADAIQKVIDITHGEKPHYYVDLANVKLIMGDKEGALKTLDDLKTKNPNYADFSVTRLRVEIQIEKGQVDQALTEAKQWTETSHHASQDTDVPPSADPNAKVGAAVTPASREARELADLVNIFDYSGHPDKALDLIQPHLGKVEDSTELAVAYVNASINANKSDDAYKLLAKLDGEGKITPDLAVPYLQLALQRGDQPAAKHIAETVKLPDFTEEQALNIIEMARASHATEVLNILLTRVNTAEGLKNKPVLAAVVGILGNTQDQDNRINAALSRSLTSLQRQRLAEACARANKKSCFDTMVSQYPTLDKMTTPQIAEYTDLYIIADRPNEILRPVGLQAVKPGAHPEVVWSYVKLAAASGNAVIIKPWVAANAPTLPLAKLQELFFIANNHHHGAISSDIAERLYTRDPSPMNRDLLIAGYNENNQPEKALPYIREAMKQPNADDSQYLLTLGKMAPRNTNAHQEMVAYAQAALQSNRGDDRAKLNYVYILLNNGRRDVALPYVKAYSADRGGEWTKLYQQLTLKPMGANGVLPKKLSREETLAMANNPNISLTTKRQLAFSLIAMGDKADAVPLFQQMANGKSPDSQETKDLLYLWGPKLNAQQFAWVRDQSAKASPYDRQKWAQVMYSYGDDHAILEYVSVTPDALYNSNLRKKYFQVLADRGNKQDYDVAMHTWVAQTTDVPALLDYAATAQAYGYSDAAQNAYQRVTQLDPGNPKALSMLASISMGKGNFSKASTYTDRALVAESQRPTKDVDPAVTHFYKAQILETKGQKQEAAAEYQQVIYATQQSGDRSIDALSRLYTAEFNVGRGQEAIAGYRALLASNPDNKNLLADFMGQLIAHQYYDEATRVANQFDKSSPYYGHQSAIKNSASQSAYDNHSRLLFAQGDIVIRFEPTEQGAVVMVPQPANTQTALAAESQRQQDLRLQLLYAQIELNTGQQAKARQRLAILDQYYPNDPQLLSFEGSFESSQGNSRKATKLLQQAQAAAPENEGISQQLYDVTHAPAPVSPAGQNYVSIDHEYRKYGSPTENIDTLTGQLSLPGSNSVNLKVANDHISPKKLISPGDGLGPQDPNYAPPGTGDRQYANLALSHFFENGSALTGTLYFGGQLDDNTNYSRNQPLGDIDTISNDGTVGAGLAYAFNNPLGRTELFGDYNRPYWDYAWAAYYNAKVDTVGIRHNVDLTKTTNLSLEAAYNNYSIEDFDVDTLNANSAVPTDDLAQTGLFRLVLTHQLQEQTKNRAYFGIQYALDGEYALHTTKYHTALSIDPSFNTRTTTYHPFDFYQHEAHVLSGLYRQDWTPSTHVAANVGWLYDRINENNGPLVGGSIDQDLTKSTTLGIRGQYSKVVDQGSGSGDGIDLGANLKYKF